VKSARGDPARFESQPSPRHYHRPCARTSHNGDAKT
jgi:hypothetical protein